MYAIFFDKGGLTVRLPTNPEKVEETSAQANEKYEIFGLGQIVVPTGMELAEYSFEAEFPHEAYSYVETPNEFRNADYYLDLFSSWRSSLAPVRFIASNGIGKDINTLVLIENLTVTEKAAEEGDKYVEFKLLEYRDFGKKSVVVVQPKSAAAPAKAKTVKTAKVTKNPKSKGKYTVRNGDTLWAIAKKFYGNGALYTKIYNANKSVIKNPNIIKNGQVLTIP